MLVYRAPRLLVALIIPILLVQTWQRKAVMSSGQTRRHQPVRTKLFKDSRQRLAVAVAQGQKDLQLAIASVVGGNDQVARTVASLGGAVLYRNDSVDYIHAKIPTSQVDALTRSNGVECAEIDVDSPVSYSAPLIKSDLESDSSRTKTIGSPPGPDTPLFNPYLPTKDIGSPQLLQDHPTFDGRGVAVAIIDNGFDLLAPELQTAKSIGGKDVAKLLDFQTSTEPGDQDDPNWVDMRDSVLAQNGYLSYKGNVYDAPGDGRYRLGLLNDESLPGNGGVFAVLWNETSNIVWVDTNQNKSFTDEKEMKEYAARKDIGIFGKDDPKTTIRESIGFTVQIRPAEKFININVGRGIHGTLTAGFAVGKNYFGGKMSAPAPNAQLFFIKMGRSTHSFIKALIMAAENPLVEAISEQSGMPTIERQDGNSADRIIVERLTDRYNKVFIFPMGNGWGLNGVAGKDSSPKILTVGGYIGKETWLANFGVAVAKNDYQIWSWGPGPNGELKPDIISIANGLAPALGWMPSQSMARVYRLPPGYWSMPSGTSLATPATLGAVAQLISGAKQSAIAYDPQRLRQAINSSARYLSEYPAYQQGNGLLQVNAAWRALKELDSVRSFDTIVSHAPVRTNVSHFFETPNEGAGIYEREGWTIGQSGTRMITFTRINGRAEPVTYHINWTGNDGTFSCGESITLPLNVPVRVPVQIQPMSVGPHGAILNLVDRSVPGYAYQVMNTVVAPEKFTPGSRYTIEHDGLLERPGTKGFYFYVPENVPALKVSWKLPPNSASLYVIPPSGKSITTTPGEGLLSKTLESSRTYANPASGVWEAVFSNNNDDRRFDERSSQPLSPTPVSLTASLLGADLNIRQTGLERSEQGMVNRYSTTFRNLFSPLENAKPEVDLASAATGRYTMKLGEQKVYDIQVPAGACFIMAKIGKASDPEADLDLYLFDCTTGQCEVRSKAVKNSSEEMSYAVNPKAGSWKVVVDCFSASSSVVNFNYQDLFTDNRLGSVKDQPSYDPQGPSQTWTDKIETAVTAFPQGQRSTMALIRLTSGDAVEIHYMHDSHLGAFLTKDIVPLGMRIVSLNVEER